jgi:hypothetical protein
LSPAFRRHPLARGTCQICPKRGGAGSLAGCVGFGEKAKPPGRRSHNGCFRVAFWVTQCRQLDRAAQVPVNATYHALLISFLSLMAGVGNQFAYDARNEPTRGPQRRKHEAPCCPHYCLAVLDYLRSQTRHAAKVIWPNPRAFMTWRPRSRKRPCGDKAHAECRNPIPRRRCATPCLSEATPARPVRAYQNS